MTKQDRTSAEQLLDTVLQLVRSRSPDCFEQEAIAAIESFAESELSALRAEAAKVLRPFATEATEFQTLPDQYNIPVKLGDLRAAAALLAKLDAGEATDGN
jgi:sulfite reductase beta subunit-like hemoprotein